MDHCTAAKQTYVAARNVYSEALQKGPTNVPAVAVFDDFFAARQLKKCLAGWTDFMSANWLDDKERKLLEMLNKQYPTA